MRQLCIAVALLLAGCGAEAGQEDGEVADEATWCCEVKAAGGNERFSRFCGLTETDAISWMRNPDEVCFDSGGHQ